MGEAKRRKKKVIPYRQISKVVARVLVAAICVLAAIDYLARRNTSLWDSADPLRIVGESTAPIKIVQFVDFQNPECNRGSKVLNGFIRKNRQDMMVSTRYFHTPDLNSLTSAIYAECASRQGRFWPYYQELFVKQNQWRRLKEAGPYLELLGNNVFVDMPMFTACVEDIEIKQIVEEDTRLGQAHGVQGVPTYFINEERFEGVDEMEKHLSEYFENKRLGFL